VKLREQNQRRRALFDMLAEGTEEGLLADLAAGMPHLPGMDRGAPLLGHLSHGLGKLGGNAALSERKVHLKKVVGFLKEQSSPQILAETWAVLGLEGPLPAASADAVREIGQVFASMHDVDGSGQVSFEFFTRFITRTRAATRDSALGRDSVGGGNMTSIVGVDARKVKPSSLVCIVQLKELKHCVDKDGRHTDPYVKLSLVCPSTERDMGRQTKQTGEHGNTAHLVWDPPEYLGFVVDKDVSKAKVVATVKTYEWEGGGHDHESLLKHSGTVEAGVLFRGVRGVRGQGPARRHSAPQEEKQLGGA
jgi:hypothetical protein